MWFSSRLRNQKRHESQRMRPSCRPRLEALEDRWLPSTLTVLNNLDRGSDSLRSEINKAHTGDTIVFAPSLTGQTITLTTGELLLKKNLTINGPGAGQLTVSGGGASRVFEVASGSQLALSGLTISGGYVGAGSLLNNGGAIANDPSATLTVSGCTFTRNHSAYKGGAIYNAGTASVTGSTFGGAFGYGNFATNGGGIYNEAGATLTVSSCTLSFNSTNSGGTGGGAIDNSGSAKISNCTLSSNATWGPDYGLGNAGAIGNEAGGTMTLSGCTLSGNIANGRGGAIYNAGTAAALTVLDSIFSGNTPDNIFGPYTDGGGNTFR
jgi:predicted outer membrane repeat protein